MNLVKAQAVANDLPISELRKYANGFNPSMIPPWVAAGVMQEKMATQQKLANLQGAAQGEQPSVKEQIEQKAGLMALQQQMKQQAMGGVPPMGSMPVPEGAPQPEPQPDAGMARGGLARLPVQFGFNGGGIVAFSGEEGSAVKSKEIEAILAKSPYDRTPEDNAKLEAAGIKLYRREIPAGSAVARADQAIKDAGSGLRGAVTAGANQLSDEELASRPAAGGALNERILRMLGMTQSRPTATAPSEDALTAAAKTFEGLPSKSGAPAAAKAGPFNPATAKSEIMQGQGAGAPAPEAMKAGLPGALAAGKAQPGSLRDEALQAIRGIPNTAPTPEEAIAQSNKLLPGVASEESQKALYAKQQQRYDDLMAQYEKSKPSGWDNLVRVFGQAAQSKGLSGLGPAYTANKESQRLQDLTFANKLNALRAEAEKEEQTGARDIYGKRADLFGKQTDQFGQNVRARAQDLAGMANQELSTQGHLQAARIAAAAREQGVDDRKIKMAEDAYARDPQAKLLLEEMKQPNVAMNPKNPRRAEIVRELDQILASKYVQFGIKIQDTTPGASGPGGTTPPPGAVREVKR